MLQNNHTEAKVPVDCKTITLVNNKTSSYLMWILNKLYKPIHSTANLKNEKGFDHVLASHLAVEFLNENVKSTFKQEPVMRIVEKTKIHLINTKNIMVYLLDLGLSGFRVTRDGKIVNTSIVKFVEDSLINLIKAFRVYNFYKDEQIELVPCLKITIIYKLSKGSYKIIVKNKDLNQESLKDVISKIWKEYGDYENSLINNDVKADTIDNIFDLVLLCFDVNETLAYNKVFVYLSDGVIDSETSAIMKNGYIIKFNKRNIHFVCVHAKYVNRISDVGPEYEEYALVITSTHLKYLANAMDGFYMTIEDFQPKSTPNIELNNYQQALLLKSKGLRKPTVPNNKLILTRYKDYIMQNVQIQSIVLNRLREGFIMENVFSAINNKKKSIKRVTEKIHINLSIAYETSVIVQYRIHVILLPNTTSPNSIIKYKYIQIEINILSDPKYAILFINSSNIKSNSPETFAQQKESMVNLHKLLDSITLTDETNKMVNKVPKIIDMNQKNFANEQLTQMWNGFEKDKLHRISDGLFERRVVLFKVDHNNISVSNNNHISVNIDAMKKIKEGIVKQNYIVINENCYIKKTNDINNNGIILVRVEHKPNLIVLVKIVLINSFDDIENIKDEFILSIKKTTKLEYISNKTLVNLITNNVIITKYLTQSSTKNTAFTKLASKEIIQSNGGNVILQNNQKIIVYNIDNGIVIEYSLT